MSYKPPYTITSKMLSLATSIGEELTKIEFESNKNITPMLRKKNRIKTLAGTLEIEGNFMGEEKITAMLDGKRVLGTYQEVLEVEGAINAYKEFENYKYDNLDDLLKAHKILMNEILKTAGSFRNVNVGVGSKDGVSHVKIMQQIKSNAKISATKLSLSVGISKRKIEENLAKLKELNLLKRVGGTRGYWEIIDA